MSFFQTSNLNYEGQLDAGNRLRVSQITTHLDIKQIHDNQPLYYDRVNIGGATQLYVNADGGSLMSVTSNLDAAICKTKMSSPYYAGKGQFIEITFSGMDNQTDVVKRSGYFSSNTSTPYDSNKDGVWFEADGTDYRVRIQKNGTDILNKPQSEWNEDVYAGHDFGSFNVLVVQFLYLGGSAVRFGFLTNGFIKWAHTYVHAGIVDSTFVISPQQPVRFEIRSTGGSGSFTQNCCQVASEGTVDEIGRQISFDLESNTINANVVGNHYALIGFRLKAAYRDVRVDILSASMLSTTNDDVHWHIRLNPDVAGTFEYVDVENSALQVAIGDTSGNPSTNLVTNGTHATAGYFTGNSDKDIFLRSNVRVGSNIDGTMDEYVLAITPMTNNLDITGALNLQEFL